MACLAESFLLWRRYRQQRFKSLGLSMNQAYVLGQLTQSDLNPSQVADLLFTDRATVTVMLQTMAKRGWIAKEKDPANRKFVRISITQQGRNKLNELQELEKSLPPREDPFKGFSPEEKADLHRLAAKLRTRMTDLPSPRSNKGERE